MDHVTFSLYSPDSFKSCCEKQSKQGAASCHTPPAISAGVRATLARGGPRDLSADSLSTGSHYAACQPCPGHPPEPWPWKHSELGLQTRPAGQLQVCCLRLSDRQTHSGEPDTGYHPASKSWGPSLLGRRTASWTDSRGPAPTPLTLGDTPFL